MFSSSHVSSLLKVFWPPNVSTGKMLSKDDALGAVNSKQAFTFILLHVVYHYAQLLHCVRLLLLLLLIICMGWPKWLLSVYYLLWLPPCLPLPSGSEASLGNSLNTSEEELHTAGITLAPKGTRGVHQPIFIQIALVLTVITITFALITITTTQKPLYIRLAALLFLHNKGTAAVTVTSPAGVICAVMWWGSWLRCCCNLLHGDVQTIPLNLNGWKQRKVTRRCHSLCWWL